MVLGLIYFIKSSIWIRWFKILGQDLVNHNINDILVNGGYPLFFLIIMAVIILITRFAAFISGTTDSCKKYNTVLFGGETEL